MVPYTYPQVHPTNHPKHRLSLGPPAEQCAFDFSSEAWHKGTDRSATVWRHTGEVRSWTGDYDENYRCSHDPALLSL
jgi:hypothetical protein